MSAIKSYFYSTPQHHLAKKEPKVFVDPSPTNSPPPERASHADWAWNRPRTWGKKTYAVILLILAAIIVAAVVPAVVVSKNKSHGYPNYYKLNYSLKETWAGESFFDNFDYFDDTDPTSGFVDYVSQAIATSENLTSSTSTTATIRVDTAVKNATSGRDSIRLVSKNGYNGGLFIFDVSHVPYGCGTWPAIWLTALTGWPNTGEIDVMETVNQGVGGNQMTLHTSQGCSMGGFRNQTGSTLSTDCYVGQQYNQNCAVQGSADSAGEAFNKIGGGIYALEWRPEGIRIWFFERNNVPANLATTPDPSVWPLPQADFPNTNCDIGAHFQNLHIITNIDLCGSWAGAESVYNELDYCPGSCSTFVAYNNTAFEQAYFTYNSFKIYSS